MHTFKFHLTQEILWHAYNAMHDASRQDRFEHESPIPSKVYALEVSIDLPDGIGAQNLRMQVTKHPLEQALVIPSVELEDKPREITAEDVKMSSCLNEPIKTLSGVEYERMMYNMRVSEDV